MHFNVSKIPTPAPLIKSASLSATMIAQVSDSTTSFNIYCTSNYDTTGACNRTDNGQPIACVIVPGGIISCKEKLQQPIQCVIFGTPVGASAYFYCTRRTDPGIKPVNQNRFAPSPAPSKNPLNDFDEPLEPIQDSNLRPPPPPLRNPFPSVF